METGTVLAIAVAGVVLLGGLFVLATTRSRDRQSALGNLSRETRARDRSRPDGPADEAPVLSGREVERAAVLERTGRELAEVRPAPPALRVPLDPEAYSVTRRQFFNRSITGMFALGLAGFGTTTIAFLWPTISGGFGSKIKVDKLDKLLAEMRETKSPVYVAEGRFYLQPYPKGAASKAADVYGGGVLAGMEEGVVALYQKCPHLGCRVPWCKSSQWFECPCHGSQYNRVGEKRGGPAPRGMDRFPVSVDGGVVSVDTAQVSQGPPIGTDTTGQQAEGPHCA